MTTLQPGQAFGPYNIINQIGPEGNVMVYKAYDSNQARDVTLKIFSSALAQSANFATRFEQVTSTIRKLGHPRILPVYDAGELEGVPYIVTRDISELRPLAEHLATGPLSLVEVTRLFTQLAEATTYAHAQGVTHGALNPDTILVDGGDNIVLTDFGLADLLPRIATAFTGPEQVRGEAPDARADTYTLGALLYALLTGHAPSSEDTALSDALKQFSDSLLVPGQLKTEFAAKGESVIRKALSANSSERFASVSDLLDAWQRAQAMPTSSAPTPALPATIALAADVARKAKTEAESKARAQVTPPPGDAVRDMLRETQATAEQNAQVEKARLARAAEEVRNQAQSPNVILSPAEAEARRAAAIMAARVAAVNDLKAAVEQKAQTTATQATRAAIPPPQRVALADVRAAQRHARAVALTLVAIVLTLCVGLPALCIGAFALIPAATPTPTRVAPVAVSTIAVKANTSTPTPPPSIAPRSSPVLRPSATPTRDVTADAVLVFSDGFKTGECNLAEGDNEKRAYKCDNGEYVMLHKMSGSRWAYYDDPYRDIVIEVDAHAVSGQAFLEYGVVFRVASDGKSLYGVSLTRDGKFTVFRYNDSKFTDLFPYIGSSAIRTGTATNRLKIIMQQNQISVYVNDTFLGSVTDSTFQSGAVGLFLNSDEPNAKAAFSHLRISEIGRASVPTAPPTPTR